MLPDKFVEKAKLELREDEKRKEQALEHFREWIQKHPYIKNVRQGKSWITAESMSPCWQQFESPNLRNLCKFMQAARISVGLKLVDDSWNVNTWRTSCASWDRSGRSNQINQIFFLAPDDLFLLQFLRTKKYMMDRVFTTFENCILAQKKYSKWFDWQDNDYEKMMELYRCGYIYPLAERDEEGRKLIFIQLRKLDPDYFTAADAIR